MIIGGSAGLITMMLFDSFAPPISRTLLAVVRVNSSIFCLVPGPALRLEIVDTVSAYRTGHILLMAATMGTEACAPHETKLTLHSVECSSRFTTGMTPGPTAAGVKSTAIMFAALRRGAFAR